MGLLVKCNHCRYLCVEKEVIKIDNFYYCCDCLLRFQEGWEK